VSEGDGTNAQGETHYNAVIVDAILCLVLMWDLRTSRECLEIQN
jgi:hypothetical protein